MPIKPGLVLATALCLVSCQGEETEKIDEQGAEQIADAEATEARVTPKIEKRLLGPNVNTDRSEILPIPSVDGKTLYFTRMDYMDREVINVHEGLSKEVDDSCEIFRNSKDKMYPGECELCIGRSVQNGDLTMFQIRDRPGLQLVGHLLGKSRVQQH